MDVNEGWADMDADADIDWGWGWADKNGICISMMRSRSMLGEKAGHG